MKKATLYIGAFLYYIRYFAYQIKLFCKRFIRWAKNNPKTAKRYAVEITVIALWIFLAPFALCVFAR